MSHLARWLPYLRLPGDGSLVDRLCFLHVPKCGGSSLSSAIRRLYPLTRSIGNRGMHGIKAAPSAEAAAFLGEDLYTYREKLLAYLLSDPYNVYVSGHLVFSERNFVRFSGEGGWRFLTILREPVARWYSHYFYDRFKPGRHARIEADLEEFVESSRAQEQGSTYVRYFSGMSGDGGFPVAAAVEAATANLNRLALVGVLEDLEDFGQIFGRTFGARLRIPIVNRTPAPRRERNRVPPELHDRIVAMCAPDLAIYEHVCAMVQARKGGRTLHRGNVGTGGNR